MKICAVGLRGMPGVMGGVEKHCEQIYPRIAALDENIQIQVIGRSPYLPARQTRDGNVDIISLWAVRNRYIETLLHTFLAVLYARFVAHADVVHIHAVGPGLFAPLARLLGMKVVFTHHGAAYKWQKWGAFTKILLRLGEKMAISASTSTIVVSASLCEHLKRQYPRHAHKLVHIPNGAAIEGGGDAGLQPHPVLEQFGLQPGSYILAVGRLVPEKGFRYLVQAFTDAQTDRKLVITGRSDHPDEYSRDLLQQQSGNIVFTGFQSGAALAAIYANAALFVLPSHHEGLPIAALEALSFGLPTLLSDIEPNLDLHLPADCYFPVGDAAALAQKISADDYSRYLADTREILVNFDWDDIAQRTLDIFTKTLPHPLARTVDKAATPDVIPPQKIKQ